jgi:hypothetical protein
MINAAHIKVIAARAVETANDKPIPKWVPGVEKVFRTSVGRPIEGPEYNSAGTEFQIRYAYKSLTWGANAIKALTGLVPAEDLILDIQAESAGKVSIVVTGSH